jgi:hypothetical protein
MSIRTATKLRQNPPRKRKAVSEILIRADGRIFAHNITPAMARVLSDLDPSNEAMSRRAAKVF